MFSRNIFKFSEKIKTRKIMVPNYFINNQVPLSKIYNNFNLKFRMESAVGFGIAGILTLWWLARPSKGKCLYFFLISLEFVSNIINPPKVEE